MPAERPLMELGIMPEVVQRFKLIDKKNHKCHLLSLQSPLHANHGLWHGR